MTMTMNSQARSRVTRTRSTLLATAVVMGLAGSVPGHVIPPENLHPVAEAYRRATFVLNLNPVVWEQVETDVTAIADHWRNIDPDAAETFEAAAGRIIAAIQGEPGGPTPAPEPPDRREAAAAVFTLLTRAVNAIGQAKLDVARQDLGSREPVRLAMREAQGVFASFDDVLLATDPIAFRAQGQRWLELSSALGTAGLLGRGEVPFQRQRFDRAATAISAYVDANFGTAFEPLPARALAPWPARSPTFDASAVLPAKLPPGSNINKQLPRPRQVLNMATRGVDERETVLIALGDMAFDSTFIFGDPARTVGLSCNTCHNKSMTNPILFVPGVSRRPGGIDVSNSFFAPHANNGHFDPLDIPDLRGIRFTAPYGRNGRFVSPREFVRNVIVNEFNGPEPDPMLLDGLVAYMFEFDFLPNQYLDRNGTLRDEASVAARRGETIFNRPFPGMNGASCADCHVPGANFVDHRRHDLGTVGHAEPYARDGALDTPTLLGITYTSPYFHDGSQPTLRAVNEWFNTSFELGLSPSELDDLTAYVETVGSGIDAYEDTTFTLQAEMEEFSFFLSAYEFMAQRSKTDLLAMTFRTIAFEIRAHRWDLQNWTHMPVLDRLARLMDDAVAALEAGDVQRVRALVGEYRQTYEEHRKLLI